MKYKWKKLITLSLIVCMFGMLLTGCGSMSAAGNEVNAPMKLDPPEPITDEAEPDTDESESNTDETNDDNENDSSDTEGASEASGKWHVYDPDIAAAVDADFEGTVHKIDADSFFISPMETKLTENDALVTISPAPDAEIPDEELVKVVFDNDTVFTLRDIYDGGERHEDSEASFQTIEKGHSVALKGKFQNDVFHADAILINIVH